MAFPTSPVNGQTTTLNNITYTYVSATNAWVRNAGNISGVTSLTISGQATVGSLITQGNILPSANVSYNLGSPTQRFNSLYLSGNTVDLSGATIKTDAATGAVAIVAQPTASNPNPTGLVISPTGAVSTVATTAGVVAVGAIATASNAATPTTTIPLIANVVITDSSYNPLDDSAVSLTGGYIRLTGSGFDATSTVLINNTPATATGFANSTTLNVQTPVLSTGTYNLYVVNSTGATGIRVNGLTASQFTAWTTAATLANVASGGSFSVSLSATSDSAITYANTTALPPGTTLASNGYFSGTVTTGTVTTYTFTVDAKDAENQDALRTFSLTVTVGPSPGLYVWGYNSYGQLGQNDSGINRSSPVQLAGTNWSLVNFGGLYATMATKTDGTLWTWGYNNYGGLGLNDIVHRSSPTQVGAGTTWSQVSPGNGSALATKTDGTLWACGINNQGQLGINVSGGYRSSPVQVGALTNWNQIFTTAGSISAAIKTDGTLWTWGVNSYGVLGQNNILYKYSSPTQVGAGTTWSKVFVNSYSIMAIKTDGTLWAWGGNIFGEMGMNDAIKRSSPVQVGSGTTWSKVSTPVSGSILAIKTDGTLWAWGRNSYGQLGTNDIANRSSPVQVGALTTWSLVSAGQYQTTATKTDGTLWTWGAATYGSLGTGDAIHRSSPVQIGTATTWSKISTGGYGVAGFVS